MNRPGCALAAAALLWAVVIPGAASAQSEEEFIEAFAGGWQVVDSRFAAGEDACRLELAGEPDGDRLPVKREGCRGELELVTGWNIEDGQMSLREEGGDRVAVLGGNQRRMSGDSAAGTPVIIERIGATGMAQLLEAARRASGCYYSGFTDECVAEAELEMPAAEEASVNVLVNLNVRAEARDEASVVGVVPADTCVSTELCVEASDGAWCRARFDDDTGWIRKLALRRDRWPVVTFFNQCDE